MAIRILSPGWRETGGATRSGARLVAPPKGLPSKFLTEGRVSDEILLEPVPAVRGRATGAAPGAVDLVADVEPGQAAIVAVRHPSGALTFHAPVESVGRGTRGSTQARFHVPVRDSGPATRGLVSKVVKVIVVKVAKMGGDALVRVALRKLVETFEAKQWRDAGRQEGWLKVTSDGLRAKRLSPGVPVSPERSLLLIHGTFSNAAAAFGPLADTKFFERVESTYRDRIFAFDHFSLSRTPEENARMLLEGLPDQATTFDVITHSRGGLVLRNLVERSSQFKSRAHRFALGRVVLVASPNNGTPLATPDRWQETVGWFANVIDWLDDVPGIPDNPWVTGAAFVSNGLVWIANHVSGDIPGLHAMDAHGGPIEELQSPPGPPRDAYSALVSNYQPPPNLVRRFLDAGLDAFFGSANDLVVPTEGGWKVDADTRFIPEDRIGCFGPGGNLPQDSVSHVNFFGQAETTEFLLRALEGRAQGLGFIDPRTALPERREARGGAPAVGARAPDAAPAIAARRAAAVARTGAPSPTAEPAPRLHIAVVNGDITYERDPLLIGHYAATRLTGTEAIVDRLLRGTMKQSLDLGLYPVAVGTHQIFINTEFEIQDQTSRDTPLPRPRAAIVVGLGAEGGLTAKELVKTVKLAVIAWAHRIAEDDKTPDTPAPSFDLAATLLASGGVGHSAGQSARLIAQGVWEANQLLSETGQSSNGAPSGGAPAEQARWPVCKSLTLIELYLDRAAEAWHALKLQQEVSPDRFTLEPNVVDDDGALRRPADSSYRGADYDFITVESRRTIKGQATIEFTLDTRRARSEVRGNRTQSRLIKRLVRSASNDSNLDIRIGRTLFNLLVPVEIEPYLVGTGEMVMALDPSVAGIPWELLDVAHDGNQLPWAISVKLIRKLRLEKYRAPLTDADSEDDVLIIGEPLCPPGYAALPGAWREAHAVRARLAGPGGLPDDRVRLLAGVTSADSGPDAEQVINTLFEKRWRIVHVAGHGAPGRKKGDPGGVVLSNGAFLGPNEIRSMRVVPELVFVNCCYLGGDVGTATPDGPYDRTRFASGVAGALIEIGVRCVVAAGWAVDDVAAERFASVFYQRILRNERFIDAVGAARQEAYDVRPPSNTWAAYQCYGDPEWRFDPDGMDPNRAKADVAAGADIASSYGLELELRRIAVQSRHQFADLSKQLARLHQLERECAALATSGTVAEAFGKAFSESGDTKNAIRWYTTASTAPDGTASMKATEQLANVKGRGAWEAVEDALRSRRRMDKRLEELPETASRGQRAAARRAAAEAATALRRSVAAGEQSIREALALLDKLNDLGPTVERLNLVGSALKRHALIQIAAGRPERPVAATLSAMRQVYTKALDRATKEKGADALYSVMNVLASDVVHLRAGPPRFNEKARDTALAIVTDKEQRNGANFWTVVARIEIDQLEAMASWNLARSKQRLWNRYSRLWRRARSPRQWTSVYDSAFLSLTRYQQAAIPKGKDPKAQREAAQDLLEKLHGIAHPERAPL